MGGTRRPKTRRRASAMSDSQGGVSSSPASATSPVLAADPGWPGRPPADAIPQFAEQFTSGWSFGQEAAKAYPNAAEAEPARTDQSKQADAERGFRDFWLSAVTASARASRGWSAAGRLELSLREAIWLDGVRDGVCSVLSPSTGRVTAVTTRTFTIRQLGSPTNVGQTLSFGILETSSTPGAASSQS